MEFLKDASLDRLADTANVAQFVSFGPGDDPEQRYARIRGFDSNHLFPGVAEAVKALLKQSLDNSVNVRSFRPDELRSNEFIYGLTDLNTAVQAVIRITRAGFHVIVNETIDVNDGGVSGVLQGGIIEFSPDDTPRCVEKPGVTSLPAEWGMSLLQKVYGFPVELAVGPSHRFEFSIHPSPRGWKNTHVLGWELEEITSGSLTPSLSWPNNFSRLIGDKAFGLLMGFEAGLPVPRTTVISRRIAPFTFGEETTSHEIWIRTCPKEQIPGHFTTLRGWTDPFALMGREDPDGISIASVLAQNAVPSDYSGAAIVNGEGKLVVEGRRGEGEVLMRGNALPEALPSTVLQDIEALYLRCHQKFGPVRFEWVHDGQQPWLVQLHRGATESFDDVIVPGDADHWFGFDVSEGLSALRLRLAALGPSDGIRLYGQVGLTSHIADAVRKSGRPARID